MKVKLIRGELLKIDNYRHNVRTDGLCGYHSFNIGEIDIPGQRNPRQRLNKIQKYYDFQGKQVLDLGCSVGGMLFHLTDIKGGIGVDNNPEVIQAAKNIAGILGRDDLQFLQYDFENDLEDLYKQINRAPDIIFLLSVKGWIKNWERLYDLARSYECPIVLETNNDQSGKYELQYFKQHGKEAKLIIDKSTDDVTGNHLRKTYMI